MIPPFTSLTLHKSLVTPLYHIFRTNTTIKFHILETIIADDSHTYGTIPVTPTRHTTKTRF